MPTRGRTGGESPWSGHKGAYRLGPWPGSLLEGASSAEAPPGGGSDASASAPPRSAGTTVSSSPVLVPRPRRRPTRNALIAIPATPSTISTQPHHGTPPPDPSPVVEAGAT